MFSQAKDTLTSDEYNELYRWYLNELQQPISADFKDVAYNTPDFVMQVNLRNSIASFAAYKEYHYIEKLNAALFDINGKPVSKQAFLKAAKTISTDFNKRFLSVEYDTAHAKAQSAAQWLDIQRNSDVAPWLVYDTAGDGRVRPAHALLDGVTKRYDDPWWTGHTPPLGFGCRCTIGQVTDGTETKNKDIPAVVVTPGFGSNPLNEPVVWNSKHPYYSKVKEEDRLKLTQLSNRYTFTVAHSTNNGVVLQSKKFKDTNKEKVINAAKILADNGNQVVLVADNYFGKRANGKNPEVELNGKIADIKHFINTAPGVGPLKNHLKTACLKFYETVIIDYENYEINMVDVNKAIEAVQGLNEIGKKHNQKLSEIILMNDTEIVKVKFKLPK